jgi:hypothetical protein
VRSCASHGRRRTILVALLATAWLCCAFAPTQARAQTEGEAPADDDIAAAVEKLKADPNLSQERKTRVLRWVRDDTPQPKRRSGFARWIMNFFVWLGQLSRALMWVVGGLLALALAWLVLRMIKEVGPIGADKRLVVPTHVRDLDIRPESLPDDIGAAAFDLWQRGEHRAALALLYRGLLSRLAHVHEVPIRDSSTEGDCLALASRHLPPERRDYVARLIQVWQHATYGGHDPQTDAVQALCVGFDAALARASQPGARHA